MWELFTADPAFTDVNHPAQEVFMEAVAARMRSFDWPTGAKSQAKALNLFTECEQPYTSLIQAQVYPQMSS